MNGPEINFYALDRAVAPVLLAAHYQTLKNNLAAAKATRLKATGMKLARAEGAVLACKEALDAFTASVTQAAEATVRAA